MDTNDIIGNVYGRLKVVSLSHIKKRTDRNENLYYYNCLCDCGNTCVVERNRLKHNTQSCGCLQKEKTSIAHKKYNTYDLFNEYGIGYTSNTNKPFYFDLEDYDKIKDYCWYENDQNYILSYYNNKHIRLHRFILNLHDADIPIIDHINNHRNDNRKTNLRIANQQTNQINRKANSNNKLQIKGIQQSKNNKRFIARIMVNGKNIHLGTYDAIKEAKQARQQAEFKYFGEFAYKGE